MPHAVHTNRLGSAVATLLETVVQKPVIVVVQALLPVAIALVHLQADAPKTQQVGFEGWCWQVLRFGSDN